MSDGVTESVDLSVRQSSLARMLEARSVAVVGASERSGSLGRRVMLEMRCPDFEGSITPVTPTYSSVLGLEAVPSLLDVGEVDLVVLAVGDTRLEEQMELAMASQAGGVVIFSPAVGDSGGATLRNRLADMAAGAGMALCGPNGMGFVNVTHGLRATGFYQPPQLAAGGVTFLSHSGSLFSAMLHNRRQLAFNLVVSTGLEIATTMDEYLDHAISLPETTAVGLFMETIRRPAEMAKVLTSARERDIPVVALKIGRTDRARAAAATHSGALAGSDGAYEAFFERHGVHRVESMDEMADTLELLSCGVRAGPGALGAVHDSGGERGLLIDAAAGAAVPLAVVESPTVDRLASVLEPGLEPENPVDAWGTGHGHDGIFAEVVRALADDPGVGVVAFCVDLTPEADAADGYVDVILAAAESLPVPLVVVANLISAIDREAAESLRSRGIPVLEGTRSALVAIGHLLARADPVFARSEVRKSTEFAIPWRQRLEDDRPLSEVELFSLLRDYGIDTAPLVVATTADEAIAAMDRLGVPVVLKAVGVAHKTEVGGVVLGVRTAEECRSGFDTLGGSGSVIVQATAAEGVEIALGVVNDEQFGPLVVVAAGGVLVELLADRKLAMPPVGPDHAGALVDRLRTAQLLGGYRGASPVDRGALIDAIVAVGTIATDLGDLITALDINPIIVSAQGATAVDALLMRERP